MTVQRWAGKRTSGRYVYRGFESARWGWQCDLHPDHEYDEDGNNTEVTDYGSADTMQEAFARALHHAIYECKYSNEEAS